MSTIRSRGLLCALVVFALATPVTRAGEVPGDLVCCKKKSSCQSCAPAPVTACYDPYCDPCKVGPIRRFFRGCHRKPCKPPCPAPVPVLVPAPVVPAAPPAVYVPQAPAATITRPEFAPPFPPSAPPPPVLPGTGSMLRRSGTLPPQTAPPTIRADRIASNGGDVVARGRADSSVQITLVHAEKSSQQRMTTDDVGRFRAHLASGTWHIYSKDLDGRQVYRGKLEVREAGMVTVRMR